MTGARLGTTRRITAPIAEADLAGLEQGDVVYIDGTIYTAREGVYRKAVEEGAPLPVDLAGVSNVNFHCSPAASPDGKGGFTVGAVTATASFRFAKWMGEWLDLSGAKVIIGKGGMSEDVYREAFVPRGARYLTTVGYGTGALLGRGVKRAVDALWLDELGLAQAMWIFEVEGLGPFIVDSDGEGTSLFERSNAHVNARLDALYGKLRRPALARYGETTSRKDEVI